MKKDWFLEKFKIFVVITSIFLISRMIILHSVLLADAPQWTDFRWVAKSSSITLPSGAKHLLLLSRSFKKQTIGVYVNDHFVRNISLDEKPSFHSIEIEDTGRGEEISVKFDAEYDFVPSQMDKGSGDNRNLSWMITYASTSLAPQNNLIVQPIRSEGFYDLERYQDVRSALERGLSKWDASWYVSIIEHGYQFNGDYRKQQNIVWPYIYPLISSFAKALFNCSAFWAAIIVNNGMFFMSLFLIYHLTRLLPVNGTLSYMPVLLLSFHPFNVFTASAFSEGLFIFCLSLSLIFLLRGRYLLFVMVGGALSGIRMVGVVAPFILLYHFFVIQKNRPSPSNLFKATLLSAASLWGLLSHMLFLKITFNDFSANFKTALSAWGPEGGRGRDISFDSLFHYARNCSHIFDPQILGTTLGLLIIVYCICYSLVRRRYLTPVEHTFILYALSLVLVTFIHPIGVFLPSLGRYTLACFPVLMLLSHQLKKGPNIAILLWLALSAYVSGLFTMSYSKGLPPF